ncbi:MAG: ATP-binding protein [Campylobacterota bacterium]|nr:ATP-binding protein [Campylobacterota bacterium]
MKVLDDFLDDFSFSDKDRIERENLKSHIVSLSSVVVDEFYRSYLKPNTKLIAFLADKDGALLLKKIKEFVVFLFNAPMNEAYMHRIEYIGLIHHSIKLPPAKVSYGFYSINQIILKLSLSNQLLRDSLGIIFKVLAIAESIMNESFYSQERKKLKEEDRNREFLKVLDDLYGITQFHEVNMNKILKLQSNNMPFGSLETEIEADHTKCAMGKSIVELKDNHDFLKNFGMDIQEIERLHVKWHTNYRELLSATAENLDLIIDEMNAITKELISSVSKPMQAYGNKSFLALKSGIQSIKSLTEVFYIGGNTSIDGQKNYLTDTIKHNIESNFSWAIKNIVIGSDRLQSDSFDIVKTIASEKDPVYIGLNIKDTIESSYLKEMFQLLFEALEMNVFIHKRERSLSHFAEKAESANRSKDIFLANMSHELRTPLNAIIGFSQIIMSRADTPDNVKKYVDKIHIAGNNLLDLVNTILDFAKLEAGKMQFTPKLSAIEQIIKEVIVLTTPLAEKKNIDVSYPNIKSLNIMLDPTLFKQVLINLLTNAIKFTPDGGTVTLDMRYDKASKEYIFEVRDSGIGISKKAQQELFKPFSQIENVYQKEQKGTGLGLMISKKIVEELHRGKIWAESEEGEGSCFYVSIPTPAVDSHTYTVNEAAGNKTVLVVEDSVEYQNIIAENLKEHYSLTFTNTVNRAKEILYENREFDFVILDYFLLDGVSSEVLKYMKDENINITCIVISAENGMHISKSLDGFSNLQSILNKDDINNICALLKGGS